MIRVDSKKITIVVAVTLSFAMAYKMSTVVDSDYIRHMEWCYHIKDVLFNAQPLWHFITWLLYEILPVDEMSVPATLNTTISALILSVALMRYAQKWLKEDWKINLLVLSSLMWGPLYFRSFNYEYFMGQTSGNPLCNPTYFCSRAIAFLVVIIYVDAEISNSLVSWKKQVLLAVLLFLSTMAKPSFLMIYGPSVGGIWLYKCFHTKKLHFIEVSHLIASVVYLGLQYMMVYVWESGVVKTSSILVNPFDVWKHYSPNILLSFLMCMAFPLCIIICLRKDFFKDLYCKLSLVMYLFGVLEFILCEESTRPYDCNFAWGMYMAEFFLWVGVTKVFLNHFELDNLKNMKQWRLQIMPVVLFIMQNMGGYLYYISIIMNPHRQA